MFSLLFLSSFVTESLYGVHLEQGPLTDAEMTQSLARSSRSLQLYMF